MRAAGETTTGRAPSGGSAASHGPTGPDLYYTALGRGADWLLRCHDCKHLITSDQINAVGACPRCGNRKVEEVRTLTLWEYLKLRTGLVDFPHRKDLLAEFSFFRRTPPAPPTPGSLQGRM